MMHNVYNDCMGDDANDSNGKKRAQGVQDEHHVAALQDQITKLTEVAARAQADVQNMKARHERDRDEITQFASSKILLTFLPLFDDLLRLRLHVDVGSSLSEGVEQLIKKLDQLCEEVGLQRIESLGKPFHPEHHEVLTAGSGEKNIVLEVFEEGYLLHGKVLRVAKVQVGDGS